MYKNLEQQIACQGLSKKVLAKDIGMEYNTLLLKISGESQFSLDEAVLIQQYLNSAKPIEELFKNFK